MDDGFSGFGPELIPFLTELGRNNHRAWFEANRERYERVVREPARAFIRAMGARLPEISPYFVADDRRAGGSLMRIHRDTRFGRDKTPYKTNVGIQFRHEAGKDVHAPGLYVHVDPTAVFLGAGTWRPEPGALARIRTRIVEEPGHWRRIVEDPDFARGFERGGEALKNAPRGFPKDHPLIDELKRKDHIAIHHLDPEHLASPAFADLVRERFLVAREYLRFICAAVGARF